jgi:hypothetical protein
LSFGDDAGAVRHEYVQPPLVSFYSARQQFRESHAFPLVPPD